MNIKITEYEVDNRDQNTTELHFKVGNENITVEVDPKDLYMNMLENNRPHILAPIDMFTLGKAYIAFGTGAIDAGIHVILPCKDGHNEQFRELFDEYFIKIGKYDAGNGESYMDKIDQYLTNKGLKI